MIIKSIKKLEHLIIFPLMTLVGEFFGVILCYDFNSIESVRLRNICFPNKILRSYNGTTSLDPITDVIIVFFQD